MDTSLVIQKERQRKVKTICGQRMDTSPSTQKGKTANSKTQRGEARRSAADLQALLLRTPIQQLLNEVVAEGVHHQLNEVVQNLREH